MSAYLVKKDVKLVLKDIGKLQGLRPGLIVTFIHCTEQWGKAPYENLVATATFAIAFSNTDYIGVATGILEDDSQAFVRGILRNHKTIVSCLFRTSETGGPAAEYIVIGR